MIQKTYVDPVTLEELELQFEDFHLELAKRLKSFLDGIQDLDISNITPVIIHSDRDKFCIGVMKNRHNGEEFAEKYRIIIEKI